MTISYKQLALWTLPIVVSLLVALYTSTVNAQRAVDARQDQERSDMKAVIAEVVRIQHDLQILLASHEERIKTLERK